jgi:hypothetical protein
MQKAAKQVFKSAGLTLKQIPVLICYQVITVWPTFFDIMISTGLTCMSLLTHHVVIWRRVCNIEHNILLELNQILEAWFAPACAGWRVGTTMNLI